MHGAIVLRALAQVTGLLLLRLSSSAVNSFGCILIGCRSVVLAPLLDVVLFIFILRLVCSAIRGRGGFRLLISLAILVTLAHG